MAVVGSTRSRTSLQSVWPLAIGPTADLIRTRNWSSSPLGEPALWPPSLRTAVDLVLGCQFPMIILWGEDLIQIYNDAYSALMGRKHPGGMGQPTHECWPEVFHINSPAYARVWLGESITMENQLFPITRNDYVEEAYFTLCYSPIRDLEGSVSGILVTVFETTALVHTARKRLSAEAELHASEERLRLALSAANGVGIWDWDVANDLFYADRKFALLYGVDPALATAGTSISRFIKNIHSDDRVRIESAVDRALQHGGPYHEEYRILLEDGTIRWVAAQGQAIFSDDGKPVRFPGVTTDVTDLKETEIALRQAEKLAAVGRLASSMAHEINNPLESVMNLLYLTRHAEETLPPTVRGYLETADQELRRISAITSQTLRFHKQATAPLCVSCEDVIGSALSIYQARLENAGIQVEKRKRARNPVLCFEGEIRQVMSNLISNAIDALHPTGGRLLLRSRDATQWSTGNKGLTITVADTGPGMDSATQRRIFEAFFTTKGIGGTGLGLWVSREIMDRHNGDLRVRSSQRNRHHGTVFTVFLPYKTATR